MSSAVAERWGVLAAAIGFTPHEPVAGFRSSASFRQLWRALGPVVGPPPRYRHWLRGSHAGKRALVVTHIEGSGSNQSVHTSAVTEIVPPLLVGASITRENALTSLFGGQDVLLGIPDVDAALRIGALDPHGVRRLLLARAGDPTFLTRMSALVRSGYSASDSTAVWSGPGQITDPRTIMAGLDGAAWIANELAVRRAACRRTDAELFVESVWRDFAAEHALAFDAPRMLIEGVVSGVAVELALETNGGVLRTGLGVRFPHEVGVRIHLRRANALEFLSRLFTDPIRTGDPFFDDAFVLSGHPAQAVRAVFSNASLRAALCSLLAASELTMTDTGIFWVWPTPVQSREALEAQLKAGLSIAEALFGAARTQGPYR
ncbi:MAG: hypothetical protein U0271_27890 [Polyangiaceae bacterium]